MSLSIPVIAAFAMLLPIALLSRAETVGPVSAATHSGLREIDGESVDGYIRASMDSAHIAPDAFAVVVTITVLAVGCAIARIVFALRLRAASVSVR